MRKSEIFAIILTATTVTSSTGPLFGQIVIHEHANAENAITNDRFISDAPSLDVVQHGNDSNVARSDQFLGLVVESTDCNTNGVLDENDITAGTSQDCNSNGRPDECDLFVPMPSQLTELIVSDAVAGDQFGHSVSISGQTAIVGANFNDDACPMDSNCNSGSAYVFRLLNGIWQEIAKLTADDAAFGDQFGCSVSMYGNTALIGARFDDAPTGDSGSAYIFREIDGVWQQVAKLTAPDGEAGDWFGQRVSLWADTAIIGAPMDSDDGSESGSAYIFRELEGTWQFVAKLTTDDAAVFDNFGWSVAVRGNTALVGAHLDTNAAGAGSGSAYVFRDMDGVWQQIAKLVADNGASGDRFGLSVALDDDTAVVGALFGGAVGSGSAYVFREIDGDWQQQAELVPPDAAPNDNFGISVAIRFDTIVVGAYHDDDHGSNSGSAYVFGEAEGAWPLFAKLNASDAVAGDTFGYSVAIEGETAFIGAVWDADAGDNSGAAYVYDLRAVSSDCNANGTPDECDIAADTSLDCNDNGIPDECDIAGQSSYDCNTNGILDECDIAGGSSQDCNTNGVPDECDIVDEFGQLIKLTSADEAAEDQYGHSVAISGDTAIIGANFDDDACPMDPNCNSGSAYVFRKIDGVWQEIAKLTTDDAESGDQFGCSVSMHGNTAVIGARFDSTPAGGTGSAYIFREIEGVWQQIAKLTAPDGEAGDWFGIRVSLWADTAIIGAPMDSDHGSESGSAYIFREIEGVWQYVAKLTADDAFALDNFGWSVAISDNTAVVGAHLDNDAGLDSGSAYVFREIDDDWQQIAKLVADNGASGDRLGVSVALHDDTAVAGALFGGAGGSGSAYVFREIDGVWQQQAELLSPDPNATDHFGISVAVHSRTVVVGAWQNDQHGLDSGSAYAFHRIGTTWWRFGIPTATDIAAGDGSGYSVAFDGRKALIGAVWKNGPGANSGAAYVTNLRAVMRVCEADFDGDGAVDERDHDIDNDGVANELDACNFTPLNAPLDLVDPDGTLLGDFDYDCDVDADDYVIFAACADGAPDDLMCAIVDLDYDSDIDLVDFSLMQLRFTGPGE